MIDLIYTDIKGVNPPPPYMHPLWVLLVLFFNETIIDLSGREYKFENKRANKLYFVHTGEYSLKAHLIDSKLLKFRIEVCHGEKVVFLLGQT
ncbi:hypothetical protein YSY22_36880 [Brevibacillus formosus]